MGVCVCLSVFGCPQLYACVSMSLRVFAGACLCLCVFACVSVCFRV